ANPEFSHITLSGTSVTSTIAASLAIDTSTFVVNANENRVGIGTASPQTELHINVAAAENVTLRLTNASSTDGFDIGVQDDGDAFIWNSDNSEIIVATNDTQRLSLAAEGNLLLQTDHNDSTSLIVTNEAGGDSARATVEANSADSGL